MSLDIRRVSGNIIIPTMNDSREISYGQQTVSKINYIGSAILDGTSVTGRVLVTENITATNAIFSSTLSAGGSATITSSDCRQEVRVDGDITATDSSTEILLAKNITGIKCTKLGTIRAEEDIEVEDCLNIWSVSAGNYITLCRSTVQENVTAQKGVSIENSVIGGTLTCSSNFLVIEGSNIDTINLRYSNEISNNPSDGMRLSLQLTENESERQHYQALKLLKSTVNHIIFEGGNGEIVLEEGSRVTGNITGGKILKL